MAKGSYESTMLRLEEMTQATNAQQMNWQERMSKTSHQMEVADLVAAGLNPVLSSNSGAQSYTTSLDSGANAIANTYSAHESAAATRYAARTSAAATKAAAAAQLAAAKYAADLNYRANEFGWESKAKIQEGINKTQLELVDKTPPKNVAGLVWKMFDQSGMRKDVVNSNFAKGIQNTVSGFLNNPIKFFKDQQNGNLNVRNFVLNSNGVKAVNSQLNKLGLNPTVQAQRLFIKAFVFHDGTALNTLSNMLRRRNNSARSNLSNLR